MSRIPLGYFSAGPGIRAMLPSDRAPKIQDDGLIRLRIELLRAGAKMLRFLIRKQAELFQIVLQLQVGLVNGRLADDVVKVESSPRHAGRGGRGVIALRVEQEVAIGFRLGC